MVAGRTLIACSVCCSCRCCSLTDLRLLLLGGSTAFSYNPSRARRKRLDGALDPSLCPGELPRTPIPRASRTRRARGRAEAANDPGPPRLGDALYPLDGPANVRTRALTPSGAAPNG